MHMLVRALAFRAPPTAVPYFRPIVQHHSQSLSSLASPLRLFSGKALTRQLQSAISSCRTFSEQPCIEGASLCRRRTGVPQFSPRIPHRMASNGEILHKRKVSPVHIDSRPPKHLKPEVANILNGDAAPSNAIEDAYMHEDDDAENVMLSTVTATADTAEWQATIEQVVKNVVSIHFCQTCSFDTDQAMSSEATGFVVDAKKGYILTNRHVVGAGPFWGYCIFDNHEEVCESVQHQADALG